MHLRLSGFANDAIRSSVLTSQAEDDAEAELWAQFDNHKCRFVGPEHWKSASAEHEPDTTTNSSNGRAA
jgi:hypothetical protein